MRKTALLICFFAIVCFFSNCTNESNNRRVLVFALTKGYHHESIPYGIAAIKKLGEQNHFEVDTTTDASMFNDKDLKQYRAVIFLSTTGNILNSDEQVAFQRYIE